MKEELQNLKDKINHDIERIGGIEEFNQYYCAPEVISDWIYQLITILERNENNG